MTLSADAMEVDKTSEADQARIKAEETQSGEVTGEILSEPDLGNPSMMRVFVPVLLSESRGTGTPEPHLVVYAEMLWSNMDGTWRVETIRDTVGGEP